MTMTKSILALVAATFFVAAAAQARQAGHGVGSGASNIIIRIDMPTHDERGRPLD